MVAPLRQAQFDYSGTQNILDRRAKMRSEMGKNKSIQEQLKSMAEEKQRGRDIAGLNYVAGAIGQIENEEEFGKLKEVVGNFGVSPNLMKNFDSYDEAEWEGKGDPDIPPFLKFRDSMSHVMTTGKEKKFEKTPTDRISMWNKDTGQKSFMNVPADTDVEKTEAPKGYTFNDPDKKDEKSGDKKAATSQKNTLIDDTRSEYQTILSGMKSPETGMFIGDYTEEDYARIQRYKQEDYARIEKGLRPKWLTGELLEDMDKVHGEKIKSKKEKAAMKKRVMAGPGGWTEKQLKKSAAKKGITVDQVIADLDRL